jgi:hypothetical protein
MRNNIGYLHMGAYIHTHITHTHTHKLIYIHIYIYIYIKYLIIYKHKLIEL